MACSISPTIAPAKNPCAAPLNTYKSAIMIDLSMNERLAVVTFPKRYPLKATLKHALTPTKVYTPVKKITDHNTVNLQISVA